MTFMLTTEQILALAPDASAAKAGQGLSGPRKWVSLGRDERAAWGECQGSGKDPYRVQVDLGGELAYRCSCPSRKLPCKHTLGLLLALAAQPAAFAQGSPPPWVAEWLQKRAETAQKRVEKQERAAQPADPGAQARRAAQQARSAAAREARVAAGLADLQLWLADLVRQGLADAPGRPSGYWGGMAARLVDAQAPGAARMLRAVATVPGAGDGWQGRLLERLALLHLLAEGFSRIDSLGDAERDDLRAALGLAIREDSLQQQPGLRDRWLVLGQRAEEEDRLLAQRTWLWGERSARPALVLSFAAGGQPLDRSLVPGTALDADLAFYPGAAPLRALVKERHAPPAPLAAFPGDTSLADAMGRYAAALAASPWVERFPLALCDVIVARGEAGWAVCDARSSRALPIDRGFAGGWRLLALGGGRPLGLFGEWDGEAFMPLAAWAEGRYTALG